MKTVLLPLDMGSYNHMSPEISGYILPTVMGYNQKEDKLSVTIISNDVILVHVNGVRKPHLEHNIAVKTKLEEMLVQEKVQT